MIDRKEVMCVNSHRFRTLSLWDHDVSLGLRGDLGGVGCVGSAFWADVITLTMVSGASHKGP